MLVFMIFMLIFLFFMLANFSCSPEHPQDTHNSPEHPPDSLVVLQVLRQAMLLVLARA